MALGGLVTAWGGDPKFRVLTEVKHPEWDRRILSMFGDWDSDRSQSAADINRFSNAWNAAYRRTIPQEDKSISAYYNGGMDRALAALRARRGAAVTAAGDRALKSVERNNKLNLMGSGLGGSSYLTRLGLGAAQDIAIKNELDQANQERADLDAIEKAKMGLLGQRLAARKNLLVPYEVRSNDLNRRISSLGNLGQQLDASRFTGLQKKRTTLDKVGEFLDASEGVITNLLSAYGGGGASYQAPNSTGWGGGTGGISGASYGSIYPGAGGAAYMSAPSPGGGGGMSVPWGV